MMSFNYCGRARYAIIAIFLGLLIGNSGAEASQANSDAKFTLYRYDKEASSSQPLEKNGKPRRMGMVDAPNGTLALKTSPSFSSGDSYTVEDGQWVRIMSMGNGWFFVEDQYTNRSGWIHHSYIEQSYSCIPNDNGVNICH